MHHEAATTPTVLASYLRFFGAACAIGLGGGVGYWLVAQIIFVVFWSPMIMGVFTGALLADAARRTRVHQFHAILATAIGVAGLVFLIAEGLRAAIAQLTVFPTPLTWPAYLAWRTHQPPIIAHAFGVTFDLPGPPGFVWGAALFELGTLAILTGFGIKGILEAPFCSHCRNWYTGRHIGSIMDFDFPQVRAHLADWDLRCVAMLIEPTIATDHAADVYLSTCGCRRSPALLIASYTTIGVRGHPQQHDLLHITIAPAELIMFEERGGLPA